MLSPRLLGALRSTGAGYSGSPPSGCSRVEATTPPIAPSLPRQFGTLIVTPHNRPVWQRRRFIRTPCAIVSQPTCSKPVPICARFSYRLQLDQR